MDRSREVAGAIADLATRSGRSVAVAESLTGGMVSSHLAAAHDAGQWFRGGIVAYASAVKHSLLGVPPGPVVSEAAAIAMAISAARVLSAEDAVAVTGVGGPGAQDGMPPGTVWIGMCRGGLCVARLHLIRGSDAADICTSTCEMALTTLLAAMQKPLPDRVPATAQDF